MSRLVYLDNQATTPCDLGVAAAMQPYLAGRFGNMHSDHRLGREAEEAVDRARGQIAALVGSTPAEIILTSGATEANNLAIKGVARWAKRRDDRRRRIITVATEHKCVLDSVRDLEREGFDPCILPVEANGRLDPERLREALRVPTVLVSIMGANNETGVVQDLPTLAGVARDAGAYVHSDAAQMAGKLPLWIQEIDLLSLSAHKMYGPQGIGALYVRRRPRVRLEPLFSGGGQESGIRSGTVPVMLAVGFGMACEIAAQTMGEEAVRSRMLRDSLLAGLQHEIPGVQVNGDMAHRLPGNLNVMFPNASATSLMFAAPDLCCSAGSACSAADIAASYVLRAMGISEQAARHSLRLSVGRFTSPNDISDAVAMLADAYRRVEAGSAILKRGIEA